MEIVTRLSEQNYKYICHSLAQKKIPYISLSYFKEDYQEQRVYILEERGKPVAMCSLVWNDKHQNFAIKRLICFRKRNAGRGYAGFFNLAYTTTEGRFSMLYSMGRQSIYAPFIGEERLSV